MTKQDIENYINNSQYKWKQYSALRDVYKINYWETKINNICVGIHLEKDYVNVMIFANDLTFKCEYIITIKKIDEAIKFIEKGVKYE